MAGKKLKAHDDQLSPEGVGRKTVKATDDADVEGHGMKTRASDDLSPEGVGRKTVKATDDADVEGHGRPVK